MYSTVIPITLGKSQTGLTLVAQLYDPSDGSAVGSPISDGFVERVNGRYDWSTSALPDNQAIGVAFLSGVEELASTVVNVSDVYDILAMKTKLDALNVSTAITISSPVDPVTGNVTIYRGDAYKSTTPKGPLVWNETTGLWVAYVGLTSVFTATSADGKATISAPAVIARVSGNHCSITVELESDDTESITNKQLADDWSFDVQSVVATDTVDSPLSGTLTIIADVSPPSD